jgi:site-specific DNA-methyltransferase (adenine-specific)
MKQDILHGDCLELMKDITHGSIDMILCDLPYGTTQNKWDSVIPLDKLWRQYERIIKDKGAIVLFAQTPFDKILGCSNLKLLKYEIIWIKNRGSGHLNAKKMPMKYHENILVFYKKSPTYNPIFTDYSESTKKIHKSGKVKTFDKKWANNNSNYNNFDKLERVYDFNRGKYPMSYLNFNVLSQTDKKRKHPTQKPTELFEYLIKTYTNEGDLVLDNCAGSGTTAIACLNTNRQFIVMEKEQEYFDIINKRVSEHMSQQKLFN